MKFHLSLGLPDFPEGWEGWDRELGISKFERKLRNYPVQFSDWCFLLGDSPTKLVLCGCLLVSMCLSAIISDCILTSQFPLYSGSFFSSWILDIKPNQHPENFPCVQQALFGLAHPLDCNLDCVIFFSEWIDPCESRLPDLIWLLSCSNEILLVLFCFVFYFMVCCGTESLKEAQLMVTDKHFLITTLYF